MQKKKELSNCFIAAPITVNTEPLRNLFRDRGIQIINALTLQSGKRSIANAIESAIRNSDFVCAVLNQQMSPNVLFEIGLAYGARKPIFLIVDKEVDIPVNLQDVFYVRASSTDIDAIQFNLNYFIKHPVKGKSSRYKASVGPKYTKIYKDPELEALQDLNQIKSNITLEKFVADLFRRAGSTVVQESRYPDSPADMAIWLDEIESSLGNPILVEVVGGDLSERRLSEAELQLRHYLTQTNARVGLLLFFDKAGKRFSASSSGWPLIIRLDVRELIEIMSNNELVTTLIDMRNKAVHGRE